MTHLGERGYLRAVRRNGESNPVTYIVVLALLAAGFYIFHVAPVYMGNLEAKEAVGEAFNKYFIDGEAVARSWLLVRLNQKNNDTRHLEVDEEGVEEWKPGFGVKEEDLTIEFDDATRTLTVRVEYDRVVEFAPLKKRKTFHLIAEKIGTQAK